jgi:hypothetical protein
VRFTYVPDAEFHSATVQSARAFAQPRPAFERLVEPDVRRDALSATSTRECRALLTAAEFGKTAATLGSSTTTLELALIRSQYLPRSSFLKSERLYSGRSSSVADLTFFINSPLTPSCNASTDNTDGFTTLRVRHNQKLAGRRHAESDQPFLAFRMVGVGTCRCQWVIENTGRFLKLNPMLSEVVRALAESHSISMPRLACLPYSAV